jgi:glycosyltransferase involved in cell wall biosynthesis
MTSPGRVRLLGFLDAPSLARVLASAHAYVLPSLAENSSNSLCEAMTVGVPCVAAAAGGTPGLVDDGRTGLLYAAGDAGALAAQLGRVLSNDLLAARLGAAARAEALERHDPGRVVSELLGAYASVIGSAAAGDAGGAPMEARA